MFISSGFRIVVAWIVKFTIMILSIEVCTYGVRDFEEVLHVS